MNFHQILRFNFEFISSYFQKIWIEFNLTNIRKIISASFLCACMFFFITKKARSKFLCSRKANFFFTFESAFKRIQKISFSFEARSINQKQDYNSTESSTNTSSYWMEGNADLKFLNSKIKTRQKIFGLT